jgi:hypothetical protein
VPNDVEGIHGPYFLVSFSSWRLAKFFFRFTFAPAFEKWRDSSAG